MNRRGNTAAARRDRSQPPNVIVDSATQRGQRHITGGRQSVRNILYMATLTARTYNPQIREMAKRLTAAGKPFKVMMTACLRKLLTLLNTMVRNKEAWRKACPATIETAATPTA